MSSAKYIHTVLEPFTSVEYYKKASNKSVILSILLFILVITVLGFIQGSKLIAQYTQPTVSALENIQADVVQNYPEDLTFTWKNNTLSFQYESSDESPNFISVPLSSHLELPYNSIPHNFAFITNTETTPANEDISSQAYLFFITPTKIFVAESISSNSWTEYSLSTLFENESSFTLDKTIVASAAQNILTAIQDNIILFQVIVVLFLTVSFFISKVWFLCIETLLMFLFLKLSNITLTVKQTISLSIHILLTTATVATLAELIYKNVTFPLHTVSFWVVLFYITYQWKKVKK